VRATFYVNGHTRGLLSAAGKNGHRSKLSFDKLIHNLEEADYVGLPGGGGGGGGGCFTESASLFVDFSAGGNPFPVMMHYQWADGSFDDEPAFGIVSGDTSMVSITANANGDSMATITPADSQSHLVAITGPPTLVTDCPACSADDVTPTGSVPVAPFVTISTPTPFAFIGSDPTIPSTPIQAIGHPNGGSFSWSLSPSNRASMAGANTDVVSIKGVNPSSSVGDTSLAVTYNVGSASPQAHIPITIRVFELLSQIGRVSVLPVSNGYNAFVSYNVLTGPGKQILQPGFSGIVVTESVSTTSATINGVPLTPQQLAGLILFTGTGATDANSEVGDRQDLQNKSGGALPSGLDIILDQELFVGSFFVRENKIEKTPSTVVITNLGPSIP
jgi:hypothetical protein